MAETTLYNQDCIAAMQQIDAESIDLIVTVNWSPDKKSNYNQSPHEAYHKYAIEGISLLMPSFILSDRFIIPIGRTPDNI